MRLTFLEGKSRWKLFGEHTSTTILFFSDRVRFGSFVPEAINRNEQIGGMIAYAWVVWDKRNQHQEGTELKWVLLENEYDERREKYEIAMA